MIGTMLGWAAQVTPLLLSVLGAVTVRGTSACPSPAAVAASFPGGSPPTRDLDDVASIEDAGPDLVITILAQDGSVRLSRRLPRTDLSPGTCSALASAVAVMIATWEIEQDPQLSLLQPGVYPPPPVPVTTFRSAPPEPPGLPAGAEFSFGLAAGMSMSRSGAVATGQAHVGLRRPRGLIGVALTLAVDGQSDLDQAGGTSKWRRLTAGAGPWLTLGQGVVSAELGAELFLGLTTVEGSGFAVDRSDQAISLGLEGVARLVGPGDLQPFLEGAVRGWFAPQEIDVLDPNQPNSRVSLPRLDGRLVVGLRLRFRT